MGRLQFFSFGCVYHFNSWMYQYFEKFYQLKKDSLSVGQQFCQYQQTEQPPLTANMGSVYGIWNPGPGLVQMYAYQIHKFSDWCDQTCMEIIRKWTLTSTFLLNYTVDYDCLIDWLIGTQCQLKQYFSYSMALVSTIIHHLRVLIQLVNNTQHLFQSINI